MELQNSEVSILAVSEDKKQSQFLSDVLPKTKKNKKDKSWDTHKSDSVDISASMLKSEKLNHQKHGKRILECCQRLEFGWVLVSTGTGEVKLRLKSAIFCRVRYCPICQWRRALMWVSRFFDAFPRIYAAHPEMRYIMLTLTVRNCAISELRSTVTQMSKAWERLTKRKSYPALGFVRSLEVTRGDDGSAHPHFHILLAVPPSYFGHSYLSKDKWAALWQDAMRLDYKPVCDVRIVKEKADKGQIFEGVAIPESTPKPLAGLMSAITETIKYTTKPADMVKESSWLLTMVDQMQNIRAVALGGIFKEFLKETEDNQDLIETETDEKVVTNEGGIHFGFRHDVKRYQRFQPNHEQELKKPEDSKKPDSITEITAKAKFARDHERAERAYLARQAGIKNSQMPKPSAIETQEQAIGTSETFACSDLADEIREAIVSGKNLKEYLESGKRKTHQAVKKPVQNELVGDFQEPDLDDGFSFGNAAHYIDDEYFD